MGSAARRPPVFVEPQGRSWQGFGGNRPPPTNSIAWGNQALLIQSQFREAIRESGFLAKLRHSPRGRNPRDVSPSLDHPFVRIVKTGNARRQFCGGVLETPGAHLVGLDPPTRTVKVHVEEIRQGMTRLVENSRRVSNEPESLRNPSRTKGSTRFLRNPIARGSDHDAQDDDAPAFGSSCIFIGSDMGVVLNRYREPRGGGLFSLCAGSKGKFWMNHPLFLMCKVLSSEHPIGGSSHV
jgi:hypothetical protein